MGKFINPIAVEVSLIRSRLTRLEMAFEYDGETSPPDANEVSTLINTIAQTMDVLERKCCNELSASPKATIDVQQL